MAAVMDGVSPLKQLGSPLAGGEEVGDRQLTTTKGRLPRSWGTGQLMLMVFTPFAPWQSPSHGGGFVLGRLRMCASPESDTEDEDDMMVTEDSSDRGDFTLARAPTPLNHMVGSEQSIDLCVRVFQDVGSSQHAAPWLGVLWCRKTEYSLSITPNFVLYNALTRLLL